MSTHGNRDRKQSTALVALVGILVVLIPASRPRTYAFSGEATRCGPANYCARTDLRVEPYPATPPELGPAGSIIHDPNFGSRIVRITDPKADPDGRGRSFMTPASGEQNAWNTDSTHFYLRTPGGEFVLYDFDPQSLKPRPEGVLPVLWGGEPEFSHTQPNLLYGAGGRRPHIQQYDASSRQVTNLNKVEDCLALEKNDHVFGITVSADDQRFNTVIGPQQDRNYLVYVFDRKRGCRWYNTETGEIGGQWGLKGTVSIPNRFGIHAAKMSKSGRYIWITRGVGTVGKEVFFAWNIDTLAVELCSSHCSGHSAMGYSHVVGPTGADHPLEFVRRPLSNLSEEDLVMADLKPLRGGEFWYSHHLSWNYVNPDDTTPLCLSTFSTFNPSTPGTPLLARNPWENEVLCMEMDGKDSKIWRFAHTYSTAKNGFWSTPRGNVSQDGRFYLFTSDWEDQLGSTPGNPAVYRSDAFVVELK